MTVKARWGAAVDIDVSADPFADEELLIPNVGTPIDLSGGEASLDARLAETLHVEASLFNEGVTCKVKDHQGTSCFACPIYQGDDLASRHGTLCRLGREQQQILTHLAVRQNGGRRE